MKIYVVSTNNVNIFINRVQFYKILWWDQNCSFFVPKSYTGSSFLGLESCTGKQSSRGLIVNTGTSGLGLSESLVAGGISVFFVSK